MVFSSATFLFIFLPAVLILYYLLPAKGRNVWLLTASLLFYSWSEPRFIALLLVSITADYFIARAMDKAEGKKRKGWLAFSLVLNIGILAYFKYANFFIDNVQQFYSWFGLEPFEWHTVALPVGISFVTFQKISYMVDVYRQDHPAQRRWDVLALYILMFPQLIAGPIIRYKEIVAQLADRSAHDTPQNRFNGLYRFFIGLSKKVLIANVLAKQVDVIFATAPGELAAGTAWLGMLAYTMQIYFDFAGYSDMALGLGRMFGFSFPENFNFPYISRSFTEFWKRWHITLGNWMKDYLYIPLGGNRKGAARTYLNLVIVFFLSGLWHGAAWTFAIWGLYHGLFLVLDKWGLRKLLDKMGKVPSVLFTFLLVMIGWVIFRADTPGYAFGYIGRLFAFAAPADGILLDTRFVVVLIAATLCAFLGIFSKIESAVNGLYERSLTINRAIVVTLVMVALYVLNGSALLAGGFNPFIYFRF
ncbi:MAG: MBOAT family protein [Bacteroidales bacterium]|nr:MBOAT family protein [Bacteroidales bacterium]